MANGSTLPMTVLILPCSTPSSSTPRTCWAWIELAPPVSAALSSRRDPPSGPHPLSPSCPHTHTQTCRLLMPQPHLRKRLKSTVTAVTKARCAHAHTHTLSSADAVRRHERVEQMRGAHAGITIEHCRVDAAPKWIWSRVNCRQLRTGKERKNV